MPGLRHLKSLPPAIPRQRSPFRLVKIIIIAAILGSLLRLFPAINIFSAADNVGIFSGDGYTGINNSPIGGIGSPYQSTYMGKAALGGSSPSFEGSFSADETLPKVYSTPLIKAASNGNLQEVAELLADGAPVNGRDSEKRTALIAAAYLGKNEICALLLDNAASLAQKDKDGYSALDFAAARGLVDTVKLLLSKSKQPDVYYHTHYAMMMKAAFSSVIEFMPKGKGKIPYVNRISPEDKTPLHVAASGGSVDLVDNMLKRGAKVNLTNRKGQTPLHSAAMSNKAFVISQLLKKSAKINVADTEGNTPLMLAAEQNHKEAVMLLLSKGADRKLRNKKGEDAVTIAGNKGFSEIVAVLQKK
ncbi:MAG: ankyrin repeat domain-containing protein [Pseudomonadota bacterium]